MQLIYFHFEFSLASRLSQLGAADANEIKYDHSSVTCMLL